MLGIIIRAFLVFASSIGSWFVAKDSLNFPVVQLVVAVITFTLLVFIIAFWSQIKNFFWIYLDNWQD